MRMEMETLVERDGLDVRNVQSWEGRPKRTRRPPPPTYWEEYVETDPWYTAALLEDVPADEIHAACYDEDFAGDECGGEDSALEEEGEDGEYEPSVSDCEVSDELNDDDGESGSEGSSAADSEEEEVQRTPERERGSEAEDGESTGSTVG